MAFYLRKSIRVGPIRFNLSNSGIGVSSGIPGFRVGIGPRGNYVHMGRGGFYYRQTLSSPESHRQLHPQQKQRSVESETHGRMQLVARGDITQMVDSSSANLLREIEQKRKWMVWWPIALFAVAVAIAVQFAINVTLWLIVPTLCLSLLSLFAIYQYDILNKSVVVMYDLEGQGLSSYQELLSGIDRLASCGAIWHVHEQADVYDPKYHAGAGQLVGRGRVSIAYRDPPYVRTNLSVPCIACGQRSLYFLPDYVLVYAPDGVGALPYDGLVFTVSTSRFIEEGAVPHDAIVVDRTWRYVNKGGGPDRRFKNNCQIPICDYEVMRISTSAGFAEVLQMSRHGVSAELRSAVASVVAGIHQVLLFEEQRQQIEQKEREAEHQGQIEPPSQTASVPSTEELQSALIELLCCVMIADGRASRSEKAIIRSLMTSEGIGWPEEECDSRIASFICDVEASSYRAVLDRSIAELSLFKRAGCEAMVMKCIELVANADELHSDRERNLCDRIRHELGSHINPL